MFKLLRDTPNLINKNQSTLNHAYLKNINTNKNLFDSFINKNLESTLENIKIGVDKTKFFTVNTKTSHISQGLNFKPITKNRFFHTDNVQQSELARKYKQRSITEIKSFENMQRVNDCLFSSDGKHFIVGNDDGIIQIFNLETGEEVKKLKAHVGAIKNLVLLNQNNYILSASLDGTIILWDLNKEKDTDQLVRTFKGHDKGVVSIAISQNNDYLVSASLDGTVRIWEIGTGKQIYKMELSSAQVAISADNKYGVSSANNPPDKPFHRIILFDLKNGTRENVMFERLNGQILAMGISHHDLKVAFNGAGGFGDFSIWLWDFDIKEVLHLIGHSAPVRHLTFSPVEKNILLSGGDDHTVRAWDINKQKIVAMFSHHKAPIKCLAIAPDGNRILSLDTNGIMYYSNLNTPKLEFTFQDVSKKSCQDQEKIDTLPTHKL